MGSKTTLRNDLPILLLALSGIVLHASACYFGKEYRVVLDLDFPGTYSAKAVCSHGGKFFAEYNLGYNSDYTYASWKFCKDIYWKTVYSCKFWNYNETASREFEVFNSDFADWVCRSGTCYWLVSRENFYIQNEASGKSEPWYQWNPAPAPPKRR
ncbi:hypothetical protein ABFS82_04G078300 [Erythranthe guttata]